MDDRLITPAKRGFATTKVWVANCKDCEAEQRAARRPNRQQSPGHDHFEYSANWAARTLERGNNRSDRCERHRKVHRQKIKALSVAYIDLLTIGEVADRQHPTGPLGGLGPLPPAHNERATTVDLSPLEMGLSDAHILELLQALTEKRVAIVEAGTGTGKSTLMPFRLMSPPENAAIRLTDFGPIIVTEPRKAAATGVAAFVGEAMCFGHDPKVCTDHIGSGFPVGYQVKGDRNWDDACQLIYVTDGTMINWLREGRLASISTVIIDEAHERSENIDIILAQLRDQLSRHKHLRVIVTSATMDKDFFVEYFGGTSNVHYQKIAAEKSFGYGVPFFIGTEITDEIIRSGLRGENVDETFDGWPAGGPSDGKRPGEDLHKTTRMLCNLARRETVPMEWKDTMPEAVAQQVIEIAAGTKHGDILGFLPTTASINDAVTSIKKGLAERKLNFDVYPLLSTTPQRIQDLALEPRSPRERRKIVISSNLAETSLTVKGVRYVVDSGLICQSEWDAGMASGSFPTKKHSRSGVRQRWGRVGRDAPGWVFPLYSLDQFRQLPRNTPPGSTQANLETFYMKLMSAGLDIQSVTLPANFTHESVEVDEAGQQNIETFNRESERALNALKASGAVDGDGFLTEFGRDLERFPGSGAEAIAVMLADQLACVHEVAFVLALLTEGKLLDRRHQGLLLMNRDWPPAWRIHAARCHRALAIDCTDELELVLRIVSEWQSADDPDQWCKTWWVNKDALVNAQAEVTDVIGTLSSGMKAEAQRPVNPQLADRARAVFARSMCALRLRRVEQGSYYFCANEKEVASLDKRALIDPGDHIIALNRFRIRPKNPDEPAKSIVSNAIRVPEWTNDSATDAETMGIDLIVQVAQHCRDPAGNLKFRTDPLAGVRRTLPIGACVDIVTTKQGGQRVITDAKNVSPPFAYPGELVQSEDEADRSLSGSTSIRRRQARESGFDAEWDPNRIRHERQAPEEELAQQIIDVRELEINDPPAPSSEPDSRDSEASGTPMGTLPRLVVRTDDETSDSVESGRVCIIGYGPIDDTSAALIVRQVDDKLSLEYPTAHMDLKYGDSVEVTVRGFVRDHDDKFAELVRSDRRGSFYPGVMRSGISANDRDVGLRLRPGSCLTGIVVPEWKGDGRTVTLVPHAIEQLRADVNSEQQTFRGDTLTFYPATIVEGPNDWNKLTVELDHRDPITGLSHRFEVRMTEFEAWEGLSCEVGQRLLVSIDFDRNRARPLKEIDANTRRFVETHSNYFSFKDDDVRAEKKDIPVDIIHKLVATNKEPSWERDVWRFYADKLHLEVRAIRPISSSTNVTVPIELLTLINEKKVEIGRSYGVSVVVKPNNTNVSVTGTSHAAVKAASDELQSIALLPYVVLAIPPNTTGIVIGTNGENIGRLRSRTNVLDVQADKDQVFIVGRSANSVQEAVKDIRRLVDKVHGELVVPSGKIKYLIGRNGETINRLRSETECWANSIDNGQRWRIEGPTKRAVEEFIRRAGAEAFGTTGTVTHSTRLEVVVDGMVKETLKPVEAPRIPKPSVPTRQRNTPPTPPVAPSVSAQQPTSQYQSSPTSSSGCVVLVAGLLVLFVAAALTTSFVVGSFGNGSSNGQPVTPKNPRRPNTTRVTPANPKNRLHYKVRVYPNKWSSPIAVPNHSSLTLTVDGQDSNCWRTRSCHSIWIRDAAKTYRCINTTINGPRPSVQIKSGESFPLDVAVGLKPGS